MITLPSGRKIGAGQPPFIIAEVGSNWRTLDDCLISIRQAKAAGADAVKFQLFDNAALYGANPDFFVAPIGVRGASPHLDLAWLPILKAHADEHAVEFMCTAFSPELYDAVNPYVSLHKVASAECTHLRILERVRSYGKPVLLSTGAHGEADIAASLDVLAGRNTQTPDAVPLSVVLLYCVANYPAREIDLEKIALLSKRFGVPAGYSDHSTDVLVIPESATHRWGACVLEKHFTAIPDVDTPDRGHALTPDQFKRMVQSVMGWRLPPTLAYQSEETPMVLRHNRRLIVTRDVAAGEGLWEGVNFGIYRSLKDDTRGLSPFAVNQVHERRATRACRAGDAIGPGDFE